MFELTPQSLLKSNYFISDKNVKEHGYFRSLATQQLLLSIERNHFFFNDVLEREGDNRQTSPKKIIKTKGLRGSLVSSVLKQSDFLGPGGSSKFSQMKIWVI